jgi:hypothetical protein
MVVLQVLHHVGMSRLGSCHEGRAPLVVDHVQELLTAETADSGCSTRSPLQQPSRQVGVSAGTTVL